MRHFCPHDIDFVLLAEFGASVYLFGPQVNPLFLYFANDGLYTMQGFTFRLSGTRNAGKSFIAAA